MTITEHLIDFESIDKLFHQLGLDLDPAECHGGLCGLLCASGTISGSVWINQMLASSRLDLTEMEKSPLHDRVAEADHGVLGNLYKETVAGLNDPEYGFSLLLPEDDKPLARRVEALARWCEGFLLGLGLGGLQDQAALPEDSLEAVRDFVEISRLNRDAVGSDNEDESAFAEIVEYVRMAVLMVYEELRSLRTARPNGAPVH